ncbi:hypothetical protein [Streptomyces sp. NPDC005438]|uniref:hypothetical protein n=1 Tax=Streptomyces sp. NPDC005438 TaxID=3156880 RepID=UPI0033AEC40D
MKKAEPAGSSARSAARPGHGEQSWGMGLPWWSLVLPAVAFAVLLVFVTAGPGLASDAARPTESLTHWLLTAIYAVLG